MEITENNDVKVYSLSAGKSLPQFLEDAKTKQASLRYNEDYRRRIEIIQDFEFTVASTRVRVSRDGEYIAATGVYPPELKLFETRELGMKVNRGLDHEVVDFMFLSDDWKKLAFLLDDRTVEFHTQYGRHHRLRVPKPGRSLCYDPESCNLFVAGSSNEVVRLDLEAGGFLAPLSLQNLSEVHQVVTNPVLPILSCAGDKGIVESYDLRDPTRVILPLKVVTDRSDGEVTCCAYSSSGMQFAAGTDAGVVRIFDVRSSRPVCERDHMNGYAIKSVNFHERKSDGKVLVGSADSKSIKLWDASSGNVVTTVESKATIHDVTFVPDSGMFFVSNDQVRIGVYFVPALGLAPRWCSFLDSMTEELEENPNKTVFDDYQFVTVDQLEQFGAKELMGTKFLQPYMHGFFMDHRLHARLKSALDPFAFEEHRKERIKAKLESKRTMRTKAKKAAVNPDLEQQLKTAAEEGNLEGSSKKRKVAASKASELLADNRFSQLFADPDFAIEEKLPNPSAALAAAIASVTRKAKKQH